MDSIIGIANEEPRESDCMIDDYLKGLNEGIGKLVDKDELNTGKEDKNTNKVLFIYHDTDGNEQIKDSKLIKDTEENTSNLRKEDKHLSIQENLLKIDDMSKSESNKSIGKENIGKFIINIDKVNEKMDKLDKLVDKQGKINAKQVGNKRETMKSGSKEMDKLDNNLDKNKEKTDTDLNSSQKYEVPTTVLSNLTVLEQTYTLEQYHKRYEQKEKQTLESIQIKEEDLHGVHECNEELHADQYNSVPYEYQNYMGMTVTSGIVTIAKDSSNLIGISIGGGAPLCPCLYIVQVFDNTPASKEGTLQSGDEVVGVNGACVKGKTKVEVAKMIQAVEGEVSIKYNKLHADPQQGKSLDIVLKKVKHRLVENMSTTTADALGLSRAILCNDTLVKKMEELENTEQMYKGLVEHSKKVLKGFLALLRVYKDFGDAFAGIGVREPQPRASEAFRQFGEYHRQMEKNGIATFHQTGLSRAILCNDTLVKKMEELENTEQMYKGLVEHSKKVLKGFLALLRVYKDFGDAFAGIGVREPQPRASEAFRQFGEYHRQMEKNGIATIKAIKPILSDLGTYLNKAIPDTKLTIRKYADTKFEYLSYCLKVKEMDDEEYSYAALQEPLYRVETGNYEYRLILRCRQDARLRFAALRSDVLVKLELLDNKHVQDVVCQLQRFIAGLASYHSTNIGLLRENSLFPIEMDLSRSSFQYECSQVPCYENNNDDEQGGVEGDADLILGEEVKPDDESQVNNNSNRSEDITKSSNSEYTSELMKEMTEPMPENAENATNLLDL
ncbi:hypothetical protein WDU94_006155 [Cyamophila willieti]